VFGPVVETCNVISNEAAETTAAAAIRGERLTCR
jgi:hypothetical protein